MSKTGGGGGMGADSMSVGGLIITFALMFSCGTEL